MEERFIRSARYTGVLALIALAVWAYYAWSAPVIVNPPGQKILYVHVPNAAPTYLGFILTAVGGIGFLSTRGAAWDRFALASAEVGVLFCTLLLVSGPIWAKAAWGAWWVWDLRLLATAVLWFIYVAYLFLRSFAEGSDAVRTFAAVYGVLGTLAIPFVRYAVELAGSRTMHPTQADRSIEGVAATLVAGTIAFLLVFCWLLAKRLAVARLEAVLDDARRRAAA
jgi:heme exporter protein C